MNFFKQYSSAISRLMITHIGMAVFGTVVFLATNQRGNGVMLAAGILSALFYGVLVYTTAWEFGAKDKPAIDAGRLSMSVMRGFYISMCAESVSILLSVLMAVSSLFGATNVAFGSLCVITYNISWMLNSCFTGIMLFFNPKSASFLLTALVYILGSVFISVFAAVGYVMGAKDRTFFPKKAQKHE